MKYYKRRPPHLYWWDSESNDFLRIEPVNHKFNVLHCMKNGEEKGSWIQGFLLYDSYKKITKEEYLWEVAEWGSGIREDKPNPQDYGIEE